MNTRKTLAYFHLRDDGKRRFGEERPGMYGRDATRHISVSLSEYGKTVSMKKESFTSFHSNRSDKKNRSLLYDHIMKTAILFIFMFRMFTVSAQAETPYPELVREDVYKTVDTVRLKITVYYPETVENKAYPALVFFFGGGWNGGNIKQFEQHSEYFAERGMICVLVDYRVRSRHGTTPFTSLEDAKSAIRFLRANAGKFHIDPDKIVASGGSAGGHLAAATAVIEKYNDENDDLNVNARPNALILFNPVIDNGPGGYGYERIGEEYIYFSPLHNLRAGAPPTVFFLGTNDGLIPVETAQYYRKVMERTGSRCDLHLYEGQGHGFFNVAKSAENFRKTIEQADEFLISIGFLSPSR
ncbi:MAG: alpha/beta hydrolase [Bacteroidales bacterium]|jgi:acetyl esterase/lipase|nr:alpha/beta hydrolase [Bacteroidales bacterium]